MSGIAGIVNFSADHLDQEIIKRMIHVLHHRGPDGTGVFSDRNVALGHVRLGIIDVANGKQPLSNEDDNIWVTFNGEIYNHRELRERLLEIGHRFKTKSDTEILVHLYEEYGTDMVNHLQGMFAFGIWDKKERRLLVVRDRMGIKPLYYCQEGENFVFASEAKSILEYPGIAVRPSEQSVWHYLTYRAVPAPGTLFEGISKLRPGYMLVLTPKGCTERCYWDIRLNLECSKSLCKMREPQEAIEAVERSLLQSVKRCLISDVPVGAFLSGGLDSSLVVAMMSRLTDAPVQTYSAAFSNAPSSDLAYARVVADRYRTNHHELLLEDHCFADNLEKLTWLRDSPLSEPAEVPLYSLAKMAHHDVKVLLCGEGTDELFAGYPKYAYDRFAPVVNWLPRSFTRLAGQMLPARFRRVQVGLRSLREKDLVTRWAQWFSPFTQREKVSLTIAGNSWEDPMEQYVERSDGCSSLDSMLYVDCKLWLPDAVLEGTDRITMGTSVECRIPFLDHELVQLAFSLPANAKVKGFTRKWLVKRIALKYLPEQIVNRYKVGFSVPLAQWFRGNLRDMCYDKICANSGLLRGMFSLREMQRLLDDHCSSRKDNSLRIWTLLGLAIWDEVYRGNAKHEVCD